MYINTLRERVKKMEPGPVSGPEAPTETQEDPSEHQGTFSLGV